MCELLVQQRDVCADDHSSNWISTAVQECLDNVLLFHQLDKGTQRKIVQVGQLQMTCHAQGQQC